MSKHRYLDKGFLFLQKFFDIVLNFCWIFLRDIEIEQIKIIGEVKTESPSRAWLDRNTQYAYIDQELWILLSHPTYRNNFKKYIIEKKVLKVFKEEKNKGGFKALLQLLMVI